MNQDKTITARETIPIENLSKRERIEKACDAAIRIKLEEEEIRKGSELRQRERIKVITSAYQVDFGYVMKLIKNVKKGRVYGYE